MILFAAPHRTMFFAGVLTLAGASLWWAVEILGRYAGLFVAPTPAIPPLFAHAGLMLYGLFPCFIAGFLFTAGPRWQNTAPVRRCVYVTVFVGFTAGVGLWLAGVYLGVHWLAAAAAFLALGWLTLWLTVLGMLLAGERSAPHLVVIAIALGLGCAGLASLALGLVRNDGMLEHLAIRTALWGTYVPLFYAVCHRMLPFFARGVIQGYAATSPVSLLGGVTLLSLLRLALGTLGRFDGLVLVDGALFVIVIASAIRWWPSPRMGPPLLASLFVASLWLPIAVALQTVRDVGYVITGNWWLGRAPVHALGIGFMAGLLIAMVTRVSLGHSGRPLVMGRTALACFVLVQAAAVARVVGEIGATWTNTWFARSLELTLALWLAGSLLWTLHVAPMVLTPRIDGRGG